VDWQFGIIQPVSWYPSIVFTLIWMLINYFNCHFFTLHVMNGKLVATNNAKNQATDGKQNVQKPEAIAE